MSGGAGGTGGASSRGPSDASAAAESGSPGEGGEFVRTDGFVLRYADFPPDAGSGSSAATGSTASTTTAGPGIDPDTQYLIFGSEPSDCAHPSVSNMCSTLGSTVEMSIAIPPALFKPGMLSIQCGDVNAYYHYQGVGGVCLSGESGRLSRGSLEIISIDSTSVMFRVVGTIMFDFNLDGLYSLHRCM